MAGRHRCRVEGGGLGGISGGRMTCVTDSCEHEWASQAGVAKLSISDGPSSFGSPMGENHRK
jgi:hypothetical protein